MSPSLVTAPAVHTQPTHGTLWTRLGLALQDFASATGVQVDWLADTPEAWTPSDALADLLADTLGAALSNVDRHGHARHVLARVRASSSDLSLLVRDDGRGAPPSAFAPQAGASLSKLRERADRLGGWLQIDSQMGQGTQLILSLPLPFTKPFQAFSR
ncbi:MAG: hypothetical protein RI920_2153 [Pseudomonadota bacterium]|jgi:signal transduction histidine kinase